MKLIFEREATFENNSDIDDKVTQKQSSRAFVNNTQQARYELELNIVMGLGSRRTITAM